MPALMKTRLLPNDRYVPVTNASPTYCRIQARGQGVRVFIGQTLPDKDVKDYFYLSNSSSHELTLPALATGDIVYARADRTPTNLTILSDQTIVSGF